MTKPLENEVVNLLLTAVKVEREVIVTLRDYIARLGTRLDAAQSNFVVLAVEDSAPLASFQRREWAEEWRDKMCATGIVRSARSSLMTMGDFLADAKTAPPMRDADEKTVVLNGGIQGEPPNHYVP
jgi:hypothetical protein